jgi:hypothetical protein
MNEQGNDNILTVQAGSPLERYFQQFGFGNMPNITPPSRGSLPLDREGARTFVLSAQSQLGLANDSTTVLWNAFLYLGGTVPSLPLACGDNGAS